MKERAWTNPSIHENIVYYYEVASGLVVAEIQMRDEISLAITRLGKAELFGGPQHWEKAKKYVEQKWVEKDAETVMPLDEQ